MLFIRLRRITTREFRGDLVVRIPGFRCRGPGPIPGQGTEVPQVAQKEKKKSLLSLVLYLSKCNRYEQFIN